MPPGPQHGLPPAADGNYGTDLPQTQPSQADLTAERHMARFSQTKEFAKLEEFIQSRIDFYKLYAPGSATNPVAYRDLPNEERGWRTLVADILIEEFSGLINAYKYAGQVSSTTQTRPRLRGSNVGRENTKMVRLPRYPTAGAFPARPFGHR
jgi:hypothetical protein